MAPMGLSQPPSVADGERVDQDRHHHGRAEEEVRGDQRRRQEADHRREAPADRQHGLDADPDQHAVLPLGSRRPHREAESREPEHDAEHRREHAEDRR